MEVAPQIMGFVAGSSCFLPYHFPSSSSSSSSFPSPSRKFRASCCLHQQHDPTYYSKRAFVFMGITVLPLLRLRNALALETPSKFQPLLLLSIHPSILPPFRFLLIWALGFQLVHIACLFFVYLSILILSKPKILIISLP